MIWKSSNTVPGIQKIYLSVNSLSCHLPNLKNGTYFLSLREKNKIQKAGN